MDDWAASNRPAPVQKTDKLWFRNESISGGNWNQLFPYQLLVVEQTGPDAYQTRRESDGKWFKYTLPMPPDSFAITMPFAVTGSVTLGGYMEEHNGAPTRMITMAGTTGVFFGRGAAPVPSQPNFLNSVFAGTVAAGTRTANSLAQVTRPIFVKNSHEQNEFDDPENGGFGSLTGYYQHRLLQLFLESYVEFKKTSAGRTCRLALATWKDEAVYLVTPLSYDVRKDSNSPLEYHYSLSLRAYKRVKLSKGGLDKVKPYTPINISPSGLSKCLNTLDNIRTVLQGAKKTIAAVGGDIERAIFEPLRLTTLAIKDTLGLPLTIADLPDTIVQDMQRAVVDFVGVKDAARSLVHLTDRPITASAQAIHENVQSLATEMGDDVRNSRTVKNKRDTHPANTAFKKPSDHFDYFRNFRVGDLNVKAHTQAKIAAERDRVRKTTRRDYQKMRDEMQAATDAFAGALNVGHSTYNRVYGLEAPATTIIQNPTDDDFNTLFYMNQLVLEMSRFAVTTNEDPKLNSIAAVAGLASRSGIAFRIPRSKFAVPFPYGSTLEQLAQTYLGNTDRWMEIATLNGLQEPYVDEVGFTLPLLVNGAQNTLFVSSADHLFVGQPVYINSDTVVRTRRTVTKIDELAVDQFMVTVDGDSNMDQFVVLANAKLEAFLPNTVNSQMVIYIPSDIEPKAEEFTTRTIPGIAEYDSFIAVGGIDLLLTPQNDLIITPDGDSRWAVGLTNIVQKVRLALSVVQGTLNRHPDYGLPLEVGMSLADLSANQVAKAVQGMFAGDPTFTGIKAARIDINGPVALVNIGVEVAGVSQVIPISAQVSR